MIRNFWLGANMSLKAPASWCFEIVLVVLILARWHDYSTDPSTNPWDAIFMVIGGSMEIALAIGTWAIWVTHALGRNSDEGSSLIRAGSIKSQVTRLGSQLFGAFASTFAVTALVILAIFTGTNRGSSWSAYALTPHTDSVSAYSSIHFAESFSSPVVACFAVLFTALVAFYLASLFSLQLWVRGYSSAAIAFVIAWAIWGLMCSLTPIPVPPAFDTTLTFDLGWALTPEKGIGWTILGLSTLIALNLAVIPLLKSGVKARQILGSRPFVMLLQFGLLLLASQTLFSKSLQGQGDVARVFFSTASGDLTQYLIVSLVPLVGVSAYVARTKRPISTTELVRFGSYRRWQVRTILREVIWSLPFLAAAPVVFWFASGSSLDLASASRFALPYLGFVAVYLLELTVAASLNWFDWDITYSWPIVAASFIALGYFSPLGANSVNVFAPFALPGDGFDHGEALGAPVSAALVVVLVVLVVTRAKPKFAQNLI